ncbi:nitric oxide reductase transcriptional regulator NorR [Aquipseudomonas guryensis]|uniref:Nitric oxide reductase transcriptional regulator NorR n=1 Tax=Aquipseudomonas guryensis TaxID=2759165 RepID=A0A7W4DEC8_9GAMM|nr:nitric oxide reductase transcriptional regulator NorR [Pseudomonas guryensis]MBB1521001.1 nitric oxide reductase transcriptional regulator NorR [Pseudomonas guryensis]
MSSSTLLNALLPLIDDLASDISEQERLQRLLRAISALLPCDAIALLRLEGEALVPIAAKGLSKDIYGRRFKIEDHPRLASILSQREATRFPSDCGLPDPYDGLIEGSTGNLEVHDCLGCPLYVLGKPWGVITLDALNPAIFGQVSLDYLEAISKLAAATVSASRKLLELSESLESEHKLVESYKEAALKRGQRELIGSSPAATRLHEEIKLVASTDLSVLISGETGVGKELVASAIHSWSTRARKNLISINCAALPENLVESELFGHVKGAFSGALTDRKGRFDAADGGTIFLDEIGELPLSVQAKLLRVLQGGFIQRVGSDKEQRVDVRVIAATNRNLFDEVLAGRFRADLFHRISVYPILVPPLRERGNDILILAGFFLESMKPRISANTIRLSGEVQSALLSYSWPGNVRELEHTLERAALKASAAEHKPRKIITIDSPHIDFNQSAAQQQESGPTGHDLAFYRDISLKEATDHFQRELISRLFEEHGNNWTSVAKAIGVDRANLSRLAKRLGLRA